MSNSTHRFFTSAFAAVALVAMPACGSDSPTGNTGDELSTLETQELVAGLFGLLEFIQIPLLDAGPAAVPYGDLYEDVVSVEETCFPTGTATIDGLITGDVDNTAGTADIDLNATIDFVGCVYPGETVVFTLNGSPDVDLMANFIVTETSLSAMISIDGAVAYATDDGKTGTCAMDLTITASASAAGVVEGLAGTACGVNSSALDLSLFSDEI